MQPDSSPSGLIQALWHDPLLRGAFLIASLIMGYQMSVTVFHPEWIGSATDWLRAALAWPQLLLVIYVSRWLSRAHLPEARSWWLLSGAMLSYTIARNLWTIYDRFIYLDHVSFPTLPDLFFILQYPFFFLALILLPGSPAWGFRLRVILDCLLLMGAATALSWYFILAPIYLESGEVFTGKMVSLGYAVGDLSMIFGLTVALIYRQCQTARAVLSLLLAAFICLVVADTWAASILLYPSHVYMTGYPPDIFWNAFYLLVPLAGLVHIRLMQISPRESHGERPDHHPIQPEDLKEVFRFLFPFMAALLACVAIAGRAILAPLTPIHPLIPSFIILGLLLLAIARQGITVLENAQLRRKWAVALASEQAMREINRRMEVFLGIAGHELKTPLTTVMLSLQMMQRRARHQPPRPGNPVGQASTSMEVSRKDLELALHQAERLNRLVNDLLDTSRIQAGRLELDLRPADLADIVRRTVEEQRQAAPERAILLHVPEEPTPIFTDADRIGQVVTNFLTNALKYSAEDRPVAVGITREGQQARVWVRDEGPGLPAADQARIWERFHRAPGIEVQSGSGIGLGLGLHISKTIIEQHQGQVGVQSAPGKGSTFWFTLPLTAPGAGG